MNKFFLTISFIMFTVLNIFSIQVKTGNTPVTESGVMTEPYIFAGKSLDFSGTASDLFFAGETLNFRGEVKSDLISIGSNVTLNGNIGHNLLIGAGITTINSKVNGTVFIGGGTVIIGKDAIINGGVFIGGGTVKISGKIIGDIYVGTGFLTIDNEVTGNVHADTGKIEISNSGKITGNLSYKSDTQMSKSNESKISGIVKFEKSKSKRMFENNKFFKEKKNMWIFGAFFKIFTFISLLIGGLLILLFPALRSLQERRTSKNIWIGTLWGLIPVLIYPMIMVILFLLIITIPLSFILLCLSLPIIFITTIIGITLSGQFLFNLFNFKKENRFLYFLLASFVFLILSFIPFAGFISTIILFPAIGWGLLLEKLFVKKLA